jgi:hypothetical protein
MNVVILTYFKVLPKHLLEGLRKLQQTSVKIIERWTSRIPNFLLSLAPQPSLGLGLLHKIRLNFLEASQHFFFLQGRVVSPTPNPHPGGPGLCIYIPQRQGGYPF